MYFAHFGVRANPFLPLSDRERIFRSAQVRETVQHFLHARDNHHGIFLLTGEVGTGKTTAIHAAVAELPAKTPVAFVPPTLASPEALLDELTQSFGLPKRARVPKAERRRKLEGFFVEQAEAGRLPVVIVDEAHLLNDTVLEHLRLLTNLRSGPHPAVQICLVAQPELVRRLRSDHLRPLRQRTTLRYTLMPLSYEETGLYLTESLRAAGANEPEAVFDAGAVRSVYSLTRGIPREINVVADQAMLIAFVRNARFVREEDVRSAKGDFGYEGVSVRPVRDAHPETEQRSANHFMRRPWEGLVDQARRIPAELGRRRAVILVAAAIAAITLVVMLTRALVGDDRRAARGRPVPRAVSSSLPLATPEQAPLPRPAKSADEAKLAEESVRVAEHTDAEASSKSSAGIAVSRPEHPPATDPESELDPGLEPSTGRPADIEARFPSTIHVDSSIPGVVWLGEERLGTAPGQFSPVPPGRYELTLELDDGTVVSKNVIVTLGSTTFVRADSSPP